MESLCLDETDLFLEQCTLEWINSIVSKRQILKQSVNPEVIFLNRGQSAIFYLALMIENLSSVLGMIKEEKMQKALLKRLSRIHLARIHPNQTYLENGDLQLNLIQKSLHLDFQELKHIKYIPSFSQDYYKIKYQILQKENKKPHHFIFIKNKESAITWINEIDSINKLVQIETLDFLERIFENSSVIWALYRDNNELPSGVIIFSRIRRMFEEDKSHTIRFNYDLKTLTI